MRSQSATPTYEFATATALALEAAFDGGRLTSDGGLPWLAEAEAVTGICAALAACVPEWRRGPVQHSLAALVRQRVFQIACGYEDQNDADTLRHDPLLKLVCGQLPESGAALASQPTLSRLENAVDRHACRRLAHAGLGSTWPSAHRRGRRRASCWTWTARTTQHMATRRGVPTTATTSSICTTRCSSSMATPTR
jgi:Transposase DDE domain group 1